MNTIGIMQPYLFPYLGYFQLMHAVDKYVIYDDVQFIKGGWINRNYILTGAQKTLITINLTGASPNKLINEINVQGNFEKVFKTIAMSYSKAPYRDDVCELLKDIFSYDDMNLGRFTGNSLVQIANYLGIETQFLYSSELHKNNELKGPAMVIEICKLLAGSTYINAIGGQELYDRKSFMDEGIKLNFLQPGQTTYKQFKQEFVPNLSIIDVMMFNSPSDIKGMLKNYELI